MLVERISTKVPNRAEVYSYLNQDISMPKIAIEELAAIAQVFIALIELNTVTKEALLSLLRR